MEAETTETYDAGEFAPVDGPGDLTRMTAIYQVIRTHGLELAPDGSVQREAQVRGIQILLDAPVEDMAEAAVRLVQTMSEDGAVIGPCADAIVDALDALDDAKITDEPVDDEPPVHRAVCMVDGCPCAVTYRPTASGGGFLILTREGIDLEASVGIGENGRPVCPLDDSHGEMTLADETLPAAEAFAQAGEKLSRPAVQADLPGILPQFNYQGCYLELEAKAAEVEVLHEDYLEKAEEARDAKKAWDKAAELFTKMALEFKRRRQAKGLDDVPTTAAPSTIVCVWNQQHPDDACPFCAASLEQRNEIVRVLNGEILPIHANGHADQVTEYRRRVDVAATVAALHELVYDVDRTVITAMTPAERAIVREWAEHQADYETLPDVLGRPHVTGTPGENGQPCAVCGVVVRAYDDIADALPVGAYVRGDCAGAQPEGHRYPERKKKAATRAKAEKPAKAAKPKKAAKKKAGR